MTSRGIGHKAILASAGSGKTFQLAHRYIELMAGGVKPDRIIALTFSRKAAGEIFDSVVGYLCQAAASPEKARATGKLIGKTDLGQQGFLQILRELLENLQRLRIGTIDSFTVGVAKAFPMELGIPPRFELLGDDGADSRIRREVLDMAFNRPNSGQTARSDFLRAYRQATFGREEKALEERLDWLIGKYRSLYQILPAVDAWGQGDCIWPEGSHWLRASGDVKAAAGQLEMMLEQDGVSDRIMKRWRTFAGATCNFGVGSTWSRDIEYLFEKLSPNIEDMRKGGVSFKMDNATCHLSDEEARLALALMAHIMKTELGIVLQKTQGIFKVLDLYEGFYDTMLRQHGELTFADVQYLLTAANRTSGGSVISRDSSADARLYIDYRLDCKLDHWLLDEFQDTSDLQWEVLRNLADEILQDTSGQRSFFLVGDVKQAIYGWRGGNARLFSRILDQYGEQIEVTHLSTSFRSCQAVIDTVNRVFDRIPAGMLPEGAVSQWQRAWQTHKCETGAVSEHGYAAVLEPDSEEGNVKPTDEDRHRVVARLLAEIDPLKRGLSAAILVRANDSGKAIVDYLRRECGIRIVHEGMASIRDNPVVLVLLSLIKFAAHPGDTLAWRHLQMSPLRKHFAEQKLNRNNLPLLLLHEIQAGGFQALVRNWGGKLNTAHPLDAFGCKRLDELVNAAIEFDRSGSRDCNDFLRFMDSYKIHDLATDDAVRVMTIHQAKGLGFDVVILPDLQTGNLATGGQPGLMLARDPVTEKPVWALEMPRRIIADNDEALAGQVKVYDEMEVFDDLCLLYVALTRAKRGLYIVTGFPGKTAKTLTPAAFLKQQLTGDTKPVEGKTAKLGDTDVVYLYEAGESEWYTRAGIEAAPAPVEQPQELPADFQRKPSQKQRLVHVQPSKAAATERKASLLFSPASRESLDMGVAIHELFEKVSWTGETDVERLTQEWSLTSTASDDLKQKAIDQFVRALAAPEIRRALARPEGNVSLWREKRFEIVLGNRWVTGAFDRVVVMRDSASRAIRATLIDFKSDSITGESDLTALAEHYRPQIDLYRAALSQMLHVKPANITAALLFTQAGIVHTIQ